MKETRKELLQNLDRYEIAQAQAAELGMKNEGRNVWEEKGIIACKAALDNMDGGFPEK